jgi:hypothetical protein
MTSEHDTKKTVEATLTYRIEILQVQMFSIAGASGIQRGYESGAKVLPRRIFLPHIHQS